MRKRALFLGGLLLLGVFPLRSFGQARISRTTELRKYVPINYGAVYGPRRMLVRASQPIIREYPSRLLGRTQSNTIEAPQSTRNVTTDETRIQDLETRLRSLESSANQIKAKLDNIPSQSSMPAGYEQRLVRLEEQMQDLRDVLAELRNFLKSKK